jgi:guanylate kinase
MNELKQLPAFQKALKNYRISDYAKTILARNKLVLCTAPSATGRNTIIRELLKTEHYHFVVSDTTRKPRVNDGIPEQNGREYWFRTESEMLADIKAGKLVEAAIIHEQQVSGMSLREIEIASTDGKIAICDIEVVGVENVIKAKPDAICLFFLPPSFSEWKRRITTRGKMSNTEYKRRLKSAHKELNIALNADYYTFVVNDDLTDTVQIVEKLAKIGEVDNKYQQKAKKLAQQLLVDVEKSLS